MKNLRYEFIQHQLLLEVLYSTRPGRPQLKIIIFSMDLFNSFSNEHDMTHIHMDILLMNENSR